MKKNAHEESESHNLVMFPASKNFRIDLEKHDVGRDPLHDLLHEYSHILEEDIPSHLDERFEVELLQEELELEGDAFDSLEAFMNRHQRGEVLTPDDRLIKLINERLSAIKEAKERIKFYLDEIEMFLPSKRK
ncbi:MAG: hypothetical protein ACXVLQ_16215 [Bacteriovorax sp.]